MLHVFILKSFKVIVFMTNIIINEALKERRAFLDHAFSAYVQNSTNDFYLFR